MANHAADALACNTSQKSQLERLQSSGKTPQKIALRARILLQAIAGEGNSAIAKALHISRPTVLLWRNRFAQAGVPGILSD
ncbi:MAG TPA: helix-turn-helix domain-containing protein, partial [Candidatus Angelobacter sp.]|nr:helix-turn-helix domain-containing protein [Candidatus Angelobacter sp.]HKV95650.1 helix-turn-helix domain-containing protein [Candidatus Angelobacter sp.]